MANFDAQIQALAGTATQSEMDDWAADGVKEIINILPEELKIECATITSLTSSTPMDLDATGKIFHVTRENANSVYHIGCRKVNPIHAGSAGDSTSLHYVTATDPIHWIESDTGGDPKLFVKPDPTASQPARVHHVTYPTVDVSAVSAIVNFPDEAEYLVVLYVAIKVLQNKMNEMVAISDLSISSSAPTIPNDPSISSPGISTVAKADISGNAPTYTKPTLIGLTSFEDFFSGTEDLNPFGDSDPGVFSTSTPPGLGTASFSTPGISTVTVASFGTAPVYTVPVVASDGGTIELTTIVALDAENTIDDFDGNAIEFDQWFSTVTHLIEDEEDTELATATLQKIQTYIQAYSQAMQNQLNVFNDANVEYQASIQEKLKEADLAYQESKEEASLLLQKEIQEYDAKIKEYQAEVNTDVQVYTLKLDRYKSEVGIVLQAWSTQQTQQLEKNKLEIQNELNEFNKENEIYKANIQAEILKHQTDAAEAQKEGDLTLQAAIQDYSLELQKYQQELALYQQNVNKEVIQYKTNLEQYGLEYQWYQGQQIKLQQDYDRGIAMLVSQGVPQPEKKERAR